MQNAAADFLDAWLRTGQLTAEDMIKGLTSHTPHFVEVCRAPAAFWSKWRTDRVLKDGEYPRCTEVMELVHSVPEGSVKTITSVLMEYVASRRVLRVRFEEFAAPSDSLYPEPPAFLCKATLTDTVAGTTVVELTGTVQRSKKEARHAGAAAVIEALVERGIATVEAVARRRPASLRTRPY